MNTSNKEDLLLDNETDDYHINIFKLLNRGEVLEKRDNGRQSSRPRRQRRTTEKEGEAVVDII